MKKFLVTLSILFLVAFAAPAYSLTITAMDSATNLAQALVGSGVTISNVTYTGAAVASGYFNDTADDLGADFFDSGIVLTSGTTSILSGSTNDGDAEGQNNGLAGDTDLEALIPGYTTYDATVLEFDFVSAGDAVYFNYFFGSDEYNEYVNTAFNDVFGFFVDGVNYALIPGTTTPVSVNNVNGGGPTYGTDPSNEMYYNNNDLNDGGPFYGFEYDGFTDVFMAEILGLTPGDTYHIQLAIADAGDHILDSGVFLQAGSFSNTPTNPVPEPASLLLLGTGLVAVAGIRRKFLKR